MKHRLKRELIAEGSQATKHVSPAELKLMTVICERDNITLRSSSSDNSSANDPSSGMYYWHVHLGLIQQFECSAELYPN